MASINNIYISYSNIMALTTNHELNNNIKIIDIKCQVFTSLFIDSNGNGYMSGFNHFGMLSSCILYSI